MTEIISVRFKEGGKSYYFNPNGLKIDAGQMVIIETSRGVEFGECIEPNQLIDEMELVSPLRPVLRIATEADFTARDENKAKEEKAFETCQQKILEHGLDMKLVEVEYSFDGSKILFFFTSDDRVDFRELVRDLASIFHTRIELRQIGVRDEAKLLGGLGVCGRPYCCSSFLDDFHPVSIKMAKTQNLSLNPTKISGACGRLMCCLKYEQEAYEDVVKRMPKQDSLVRTPDGIGDIMSIQLLRETVKVRLDSDPEKPRIYRLEEIEVIRNGKGPRPEGFEKPEEPVRQPRLRKDAPKPADTEETAAAEEETPARPERTRKPMRPIPGRSLNDILPSEETAESIPAEAAPEAEPVPEEEAAVPEAGETREKKGNGRNRGRRNRNRGAKSGQPRQEGQAQVTPAVSNESAVPANGEKKTPKQGQHKNGGHRPPKKQNGSQTPAKQDGQTAAPKQDAPSGEKKQGGNPRHRNHRRGGHRPNGGGKPQQPKAE